MYSKQLFAAAPTLALPCALHSHGSACGSSCPSLLPPQLNRNSMGWTLLWHNRPAPQSCATELLPVPLLSQHPHAMLGMPQPQNWARNWRRAVRKIHASPVLFVSGQPFRFIVLGSESLVLSCISHLRKPSQACQILQGFLSKLGQAEKFYILLTVNLKATQTFILLAALVWVFHDIWPTWLEFSVWGFITKS